MLVERVFAGQWHFPVCRSHPCPPQPSSIAAFLRTQGTACSLQPSEEANTGGSGSRDAFTKGFQARTSFSKPGATLPFYLTNTGSSDHLEICPAFKFLQSSFKENTLHSHAANRNVIFG